MKPVQWQYLLQTTFFTLICAGCASGIGDHSRSIPEIHINDLIGTWSNLSMKITYLDMDSVYEVPEGKWEEMLNIQPIKTTYLKDSTFHSEYFNLDGSPLFTASGKWYLKGDSLYLETQGMVTAYQFTMENNVGRFVGVLDWNEDGKYNELYDGHQQKL